MVCFHITRLHRKMGKQSSLKTVSQCNPTQLWTSLQLLKWPTEPFKSRGQQLWKFVEQKNIFTKEKGLTPTGSVWDTNMAAAWRNVMRKCSISITKILIKNKYNIDSKKHRWFFHLFPCHIKLYILVRNEKGSTRLKRRKNSPISKIPEYLWTRP